MNTHSLKSFLIAFFLFMIGIDADLFIFKLLLCMCSVAWFCMGILETKEVRKWVEDNFNIVIDIEN